MKAWVFPFCLFEHFFLICSIVSYADVRMKAWVFPLFLFLNNFLLIFDLFPSHLIPMSAWKLDFFRLEKKLLSPTYCLCWGTPCISQERF
jgi:hypothetical protein